MWLQWDWGDGPQIRGRKTQLFPAWLAWSRFRVVIPAWDQQLGTLTWCIDQALRAAGGAPAYLLTDNPKTVTMDHVAGIPVRHPEMVALGRHYGCKVETTPRLPNRRSLRPRSHGQQRGTYRSHLYSPGRHSPRQGHGRHETRHPDCPASGIGWPDVAQVIRIRHDFGPTRRP